MVNQYTSLTCHPRPCRDGTYNVDCKNGAGEGACSGSMCAAGKYGPVGSTSSGAATCTSCVDGKFQTATATGVSVCWDCIAGKYSLTVDSVCTDCIPGKYSQTTVASSEAVCTNCTAGKYSPTSVASSQFICTDCIPGKYSLASGIHGEFLRLLFFHSNKQADYYLAALEQ
jgi:hypothetical protein